MREYLITEVEVEELDDGRTMYTTTCPHCGKVNSATHILPPIEFTQDCHGDCLCSYTVRPPKTTATGVDLIHEFLHSS